MASLREDPSPRLQGDEVAVDQETLQLSDHSMVQTDTRAQGLKARRPPKLSEAPEIATST